MITVLAFWAGLNLIVLTVCTTVFKLYQVYRQDLHRDRLEETSRELFRIDFKKSQAWADEYAMDLVEKSLGKNEKYPYLLIKDIQDALEQKRRWRGNELTTTVAPVDN